MNNKHLKFCFDHGLFYEIMGECPICVKDAKVKPSVPAYTIDDHLKAQLNHRITQIVDGIIASTSLEFLMKNGTADSLVRAESIARQTVEATKTL